MSYIRSCNNTRNIWPLERREKERSERLTGSKTLGLSCPPITIIHQLAFRILTFTRITRRTHPCPRAPAHGLAKCINTLALRGGILWREQPAPETVHEHRGTKVAPEWRLDGYVWKSSLWKSSPSSLIPPGLGRCIHTVLWTPRTEYKVGCWKGAEEKLLRKMWFSRREILFRTPKCVLKSLWKVKWSNRQTHRDEKFIYFANAQNFVLYLWRSIIM